MAFDPLPRSYRKASVGSDSKAFALDFESLLRDWHVVTQKTIEPTSQQQPQQPSGKRLAICLLAVALAACTTGQSTMAGVGKEWVRKPPPTVIYVQPLPPPE